MSPRDAVSRQICSLLRVGCRHFSLAPRPLLPRGSSDADPSKTYIRSYVTRPARPSPPTKLEKIIRDTIKAGLPSEKFAVWLTSVQASGPVSVSTYMQLCLSHPTEGYYMNTANPVFGARGDFITSPEISQVFGEVRRAVACCLPHKVPG